METKPVEIPADIVEKIQIKIRYTPHNSVQEYVADILARSLDDEGGDKLTEDDEKKVQERLRALGYIE